jgi:putative ATP-dependent endonuclease of the OLD family
MLIKSISVKNFRCAKKATLRCGPLTAMVGANGAGKSTFLRALSVFYDPAPKIDKRDWYNEEQANPIQIAITFADLGDAAKKQFSKYLDGDELTVERVISFSDDKIQSKYFGARQSIREFNDAKNLESAAHFKDAYKLLAGQYIGLPEYTNRPDATDALNMWEAEHPEKCTRERDDGQFFGFSEVGLGRLSEFTKHIYVSAVRDAGADADEARDSPVKEIIDIVVRNSLSAHSSILELKARTKKEYDEIVDPKNLMGLSTLQEQLNTTLSEYVSEAKVELSWLPTKEVQLELPKTAVSLFEDGYKCSVNRTGHGLQRAFILTMLQHLAVTESAAVNIQDEGSSEDPRVTPDLILCIEEPEVYQHPSRQRHFATVLRRLATGTIKGVARKTQVLYSTHSPMFVGLDRFDQIRVLRKVVNEPKKPKISQISESTLAIVANKLWIICGDGRPEFTAESLLPRLETIMTPWMNEGFFAQLVVLVEGEDDVAAIKGAALAGDVDLDSLDIAIIPCGGKNNIDRPAIIFKMLNIPTYLVWDSDSPKEGSNVKTNRNLLKLLGEPGIDFPSKIGKTFACFEKKLESMLEQEIGSEIIEAAKQEIIKTNPGAKTEDCLKRPALFRDLLSMAAGKGKKSISLESLVANVLDLYKRSRDLLNQNE